MKKEIKFSLVFRDMWQSAGKYVPRVDQLVKVAPAIIEMGCFARVETNGGGFEQVNLLFGENPNKAVREWTKPFHEAGIQTHMLDRALNGLRMSPVPADVRKLFYKVKKAQGTDITRTFCGLNDTRNIIPSIGYAHDAGMISQCSLCITHSPIHTVEYYTNMALKLIKAGADEICIKDMAGIGRPVSLGKIVANIKAAILIFCVIYTSIKVKEMPPAEYAEYHGITEEEEHEKTNMLKLLINAPKAFWTIGLVQFFCWFAFMFMWTYTNGSIAANAFDAPTVEHLVDGVTKIVLDTKSLQYQNAADWVGVLFAVQAIGSVLWAICIPMFKDRRCVYSLSLVLGGIGFISTYFIHDPYMLFISFLLIGCAWAAMLALPFTILTNALSGGHMGTYLGLFNGTICIPQIIAAALGGIILALFTPKGGLPPEINMLVLAGVMLIIGAFCVYLIKETKGEKAN